MKSAGTVFEVRDSDDVTYLAACVNDLSGLGGGQAAVLDASTLCSTSKEKEMGLPDEGSVSITVFYDPADPAHQRMLDLRASQEAGHFKVTLSDPGNEVWDFTGFVTAAPLEGLSVDSLVTMTYAVEITGLITRT